MAMKTVSTRVPEEYISSLGSNTSAGLRELIEREQVTLTVQPKKGVSDEELSDELSHLGILPYEWAPESREAVNMERWMSSSQAGIKLKYEGKTDNYAKNVMSAAVAESKRMTDSGTAGGGLLSSGIDPVILAMMSLAEFYLASEGDLWQVINVPLEVGFQDFDLIGGDKSSRTTIRQHLEDDLNIYDKLEACWIDYMTYGQSVPLNLKDGNMTASIILPNPKHIAIGQQTGLGERGFFYAPPDEKTLTQVLGAAPSFVFQPNRTGEWNERQVPMKMVPLASTSLTHLHVPKSDHSLYGQPLLSRATRSIDSRRYLEEMARATIEGIRNQLWVFTIDNPMRGEVTSLQNMLSGSRSARTGMLVWRGGLKAQQFIPGSIDALLGNDTFWEFTQRIYRNLGLSIRFVSGESPNRTSGSDATTDIQIGLNKMLYNRQKFQRWLQTYVNEMSPRNGNNHVIVRMKDIEMQVASRIKDVLAPLMNFGLPSPTTAYAIAGLDADVEIAQHKSEAAFRDEYIKPYTSFAQNGPTGPSQSTEPGRPPGKVEMQPRQESDAAPKRAISASQNDVIASIIGDYTKTVVDDWDDFATTVADPNVNKEEKKRKANLFILALMAAAASFRRPAYIFGYTSNGGAGKPDEDSIQAAVAWDNANAQRFEDELLARIDAGESVGTSAFRAMLYPREGYKNAFVAGVFQAKIEQGYTGWQRILRPYASKTGPCAICKADAKNIHSIDEPFFDHPSGVCGQQFITFYHGVTPGGVVRVPSLTLE